MCVGMSVYAGEIERMRVCVCIVIFVVENDVQIMKFWFEICLVKSVLFDLKISCFCCWSQEILRSDSMRYSNII